ncbi:MAG: M14 family zinc carboxypeptidase [Ignavibacteriaceae bacterium]
MLNQLITQLNSIYPVIKENSLTNKHFKHNDITLLLKKLDFFNIIKIGNSVENREIFSVSHKSGPVRILLWSQMHGDEACATSAFFDIFNFFSSKQIFNQYPFLNRIREDILLSLSLTFIPMLNPDGAEHGIRENALGIDLNRDAKDLISPESKILTSIVKTYKPDYAFNMHDQDYLWSVGDSNRIAALSFLAPPYDADKSVNDSRQGAVNLISLLYNTFNSLVDRRTTKYSDDFEPRAFGDTIAGRNISTILVESGLWKNDSDKLYLRKMNFMILIFSFYAIAKGLIPFDSETYSSIPYNGTILSQMD